MIAQLINYATVALGLGFVIFIHELGHFLMAKWNGVKVEKFSIGFGPALFKFRRGETEYALAIIPLGGFVKMLGEGDEANTHAEPTTDPRAFSNQTVYARMGIISAGVVMNLILGVICFVAVYGKGGMPVAPAKVQLVVAGSPAYEAGLRSGDEIVSANGSKVADFLALKRMTAFSAPGSTLHLEVKRREVDTPVRLDVVPQREPGGDMKTIGIAPASDVTLAKPPFFPPAGFTGKAPEQLQEDDKVVAIGPRGSELTPVHDAFDVEELLSRNRAKPLTVKVERPAKEPKGKPTTFEVELPVVPFVDFGIRLTPGPVVSVQNGSPAQEAGFRAGDRIIAVDGNRAFDPMRLPDLMRERAGKPVVVSIERGKAGAVETLKLEVTPDDSPTWIELVVPSEPLEVPGLGLAMDVLPRIAGIAPGSPAAKAGLKVGGAIQSVTIDKTPNGSDPEKTTSHTWNLEGKEKASWPGVFSIVQSLPCQPVKFVVNGSETTIDLTPVASTGWPSPDRGLQFQTLIRELPPMSAGAAIHRGFDDTRSTIVGIYAMLRGLLTGEIAGSSVGGPLLIADMASKAAKNGFITFIWFIGMLSVNLAVINFLPVPPLDGGHMAFLIAEKIRGKPLPEKAMNLGMMTGLVLVLGLMLFVLTQDVIRYLFTSG
jgi:regulator of sigma E protease